MFISVVIPLFNKAQSIGRAIQSVLTQEYQNFELIIVDDGSTDDSLTQVKQFNDPRIRLFSQRNQGVSIARNNGVKHAKADYVAFLDADDSYHPDFLCRIVELINANPQAAMFCCRFQLVDEQNAVFVPKGTLPNGFIGQLPCFFTSFKQNRSLIHPSSMAVNKKLFWSVGGFPAQKAVGEDLQLMLLLALQAPVMADYRVAATVFRNAENRTIDRKPAQSSCHLEYFLAGKHWQHNFEHAQIKALLSFVSYNALLHAAGAAANNQPTLARHYAALLWPQHKTYSLLSWLISLAPMSWLNYLKNRRNHG